MRKNNFETTPSPSLEQSIIEAFKVSKGNNHTIDKNLRALIPTIREARDFWGKIQTQEINLEIIAHEANQEHKEMIEAGKMCLFDETIMKRFFQNWLRISFSGLRKEIPGI